MKTSPRTNNFAANISQKKQSQSRKANGSNIGKSTGPAAKKTIQKATFVQENKPSVVSQTPQNRAVTESPIVKSGEQTVIDLSKVQNSARVDKEKPAEIHETPITEEEQLVKNTSDIQKLTKESSSLKEDASPKPTVEGETPQVEIRNKTQVEMKNEPAKRKKKEVDIMKPMQSNRGPQDKAPSEQEEEEEGEEE